MSYPTRILLVDDDERIRFVLGGALSKLGNDVQIATAGDSRTALDKGRETYYDLLITDLRLPRSDGLALTAAFATVSPKTKVIWITAYGCHRFAAAQERLGVCRCLNKPVEIQDIRSVVIDVLEEETSDRNTGPNQDSVEQT